MLPIINIAVKAARRGAAVINQSIPKLESITVHSKAHNDFVTEVDRAAENAIIDVLKNAYPDYDILAEESGHLNNDSEYQWIIDPLDGTTNFIHGFPQYAVSIALMHQQVLQHAVIYDPSRNELFTASRGAGAYLNERRIRASKRTKLSDSLIGTGFPFRDFRHLDTYLDMFSELITHSAGVRRAGAASLDLAYVACGRLDGFWEIGLSPWDIAAGTLLAQEAGALVADLSGGDAYMESGNIVTANPKVFAQLMPMLTKHWNNRQQGSI